MKLSIVAAVAENGVIGLDKGIPWHLPADLAHFKTLTMGKPILMGRKTFESIGRPLPGRHNVVVSRDPSLSFAGCSVVGSFEDALQLLKSAEEVMVIGGAEIYRLALPLADRLYLTRVHASFEGDTYFPDYDPDLWREVAIEEHAADGRNPHAYSFVILDRI